MADSTYETVEYTEAKPKNTQTEIGFISPDLTMLIMTWLTFITVLVVLSKYAWKPILKGLKDREDSLRQSIENAEKLETELRHLDEKRTRLMEEAKTEAKSILDESRQAAKEAAQSIENKAREEAKILVENAKRDITAEKDRAKAELKHQSAQIAVELAEKLIRENLDEEKNSRLIKDYIQSI